MLTNPSPCHLPLSPGFVWDFYLFRSEYYITQFRPFLFFVLLFFFSSGRWQGEEEEKRYKRDISIDCGIFLPVNNNQNALPNALPLIKSQRIRHRLLKCPVIKTLYLVKPGRWRELPFSGPIILHRMPTGWRLAPS
jgi:hypothetical protein